ncbi:hypothetical protein KDA14_03220, partial [Candidatus Saccharibacteria bacterium]|nr:hypothetical protein [Candidatus Saccharibacteria bacterium]
MATIVAISVMPAPVAHAANFSMRTGYYTGTGASQSIGGLGSQPDLVIITPSTSAGVSVFKTSAMATADTAYLSATVTDTGSNLVLDSDGFSVGTLANVNNANVLYRWFAFFGSDCSSTGYMCVGTYTGTGAASRTIATGFQPDMISVKRSTGVAAHFRTATMAANRTEYFTTTAANTTGAFIANSTTSGFNVGTSDNTNAASYYFFAFRAGGGTFEEASYTGNATDNRSITGVGFQPSMVIVKNSTSTTANNRRSVISSDKHFADDTSYFSDAVADGTNLIQGMESDGFQIGTGNQTNQNATTEYYMAFGGAPSLSGSSGSFSMAQGSYSGNGSSQSISGVGFKPDLVMVNGEGSSFAVFRTNYMVGDATAYFASGTADFAGGVTSLDADGFSVGNNATVNTNATTYHWQAFGGAYNSNTQTGSADFATGVYYGTGGDSRNIDDIPFQPDLVVIKRAGASLATIRTSQYTGDLAGYFSTTADAANIIQTLNPNGFQVGTSAVSNGNASLYRWFAFKIGTNFELGAYTGNAVNGRQIDAPFWSDLIWVNRSTGSGSVQKPSTITGVNTQSFLNSAMIANGITSINASGFTLGTNAAVNTSGSSYRFAVWRVPPTGALSVDVVDSGGGLIASPQFDFTTLSTVFGCTASTGSLGTSSQRIRIANQSAGSSWTMSIAPTDGPTTLWRNVGDTAQYDFNDISGSGCQDSTDA